MPKVGMQPIRRQQLIAAAFEVIQSGGLEHATIASVAAAAGLSTGIVAHYFGSKEGLLEATMRHVLRDLRAAVARHRSRVVSDTPRNQLQAIIEGNFDSTQTNPTAMRIWLDFWSASLNRPELARLQRANDRRLRSNLSYQFTRVLPRPRAQAAATGLAAMIDGLWLRSALAGRTFDTAQARAIAYAYVEQHLPSQMTKAERHAAAKGKR